MRQVGPRSGKLPGGCGLPGRIFGGRFRNNHCESGQPSDRERLCRGGRECGAAPRLVTAAARDRFPGAALAASHALLCCRCVRPRDLSCPDRHIAVCSRRCSRRLARGWISPSMDALLLCQRHRRRALQRHRGTFYPIGCAQPDACLEVLRRWRSCARRRGYRASPAGDGTCAERLRLHFFNCRDPDACLFGQFRLGG